MPARPLLIPGFAKILHGGDYNPDQWLASPEVIEEDFRLMPIAGCNTFAVGIFGWSALEPSDGAYRFDWLDSVMDRMAAIGNKVALATPSGAKPAWLAKAHPEVCRVTREGQREVYRDRHNHCWASPIYREKVRAINERLAERYRGHAALGMWHISNEYAGDCYCELCLARFHAWLAERYCSLDALNQAWWTGFWSHQFSAWNEVDPRDQTLDGLVIDWKRFATQQIVDFIEWEKEPLKRLTPEVPCTTNFMGLYTNVDYSTLGEHVDLIADDQYPAFDERSPETLERAIGIAFKDDVYRCMHPDRPWMVMESCPDAPQWKHPMRMKPAQLHRAEMLQALAHGAEGTCYFQWRKGRGGSEKHHGAVVDHAGENTRVFRSVAEIGKSYDKLAEILGSAVESEVAFLYDWDSRWAYEAVGGTPSKVVNYEDNAKLHYRAFWEMGISVDAIRSDRDFSSYRVVVLPMLHLLKPGVASRLAEFVERGGTLIGSYYTGFVDLSARCFLGGFPGDGLIQVFGIWNEETDCLAPGMQQALARSSACALQLAERYSIRDICALVEARGASVLGTYTDGFYAGTPALTRHEFGRGRAYYQAANLELDFLRDFYRAICREAGVKPALPIDLPEGVTAQRRRKGSREYFFVQNFGLTVKELELTGMNLVDLETGRSVPGALALAPFESVVLARG